MKLSVLELKKTYAEKVAVDSVSFEMESGSTVGLLGPNGAGKTTLFYMIVGLLSSNSGTIKMDGSDIGNTNISTRSLLGLSYLPQEPSIFRKLTVKENILSALQQREDLDEKSIQKELDRLVEEFDLNDFVNTLGIKLSGGERRRTEIARSLGSNPKFVLLDEPFAGIDPIAVSELKQSIKTLNSKDIGVLISDHNVRDTMQICNHVLIINQGKIIAEGKPEHIRTDPLVKEVYLGNDFID